MIDLVINHRLHSPNMSSESVESESVHSVARAATVAV